MPNRLDLSTNKNIFLFSSLLRVVLPLFIFKYPLFGVVAATFLDIIDIEFASRKVLTLMQYEITDKVLDTWWYFVALAYSGSFMPQFFLILLPLFIYRLAGVVLFFLRRERKILFFFPAFIENVFLLFFFSLYFQSLNFLTEGNNLYFSLLVVSLFKIGQEFWVHIAEISIPEDILKMKRDWVS